jgi:hypothetical protein
MWFARPAVSAVDQDCSSNDMRPVCDHGRAYQPTKRNLQLLVAPLHDSIHSYDDWRQYMRAECYVLHATFGVHAAQRSHSVLTTASAKFGLKLA